MATTTNYGWTTPDDTALVKDGAAAIRTLGSSIDTSLNTALGTKKAGMVLLNTTTFSAVASQAVNSCFSATYDNYRIVYDLVASTSSTLSFRFRLATTDNSTSNYNEQFISASSTSLTGGRATSTSFDNAVTTDRSLFIMDLSNVFLATPTGMWKTGTRYYSTNANIAAIISAHSHNVSSSFDGFNLIASTGTITGSVSVYGYNK